jgi:hypothetical protein
VTLRRVFLLVLMGCASPMTVAELRDAEAPPSQGADSGDLPSFGEAGLVDAGDDGPIIHDPPPDPEPGDAGDAGDSADVGDAA